MSEISGGLIGPHSNATTISKDPQLWKLSKSLEATFLSERLAAAVMNASGSEFGGGIGEEQFSSFLVQKRAEAMVENGGIGLAQSIYDSLTSSGGINENRR